MFYMRICFLVYAVASFSCFGCESNDSTTNNIFQETHPLFGIKSISIIKTSFLPGDIELKNDIVKKEVLLFDNSGRLQKISYFNEGGIAAAHRTFEYDENGNAIKRELLSGSGRKGLIHYFKYDDKNNLVEWTEQEVGIGQGSHEKYLYDEDGKSIGFIGLDKTGKEIYRSKISRDANSIIFGPSYSDIVNAPSENKTEVQKKNEAEQVTERILCSFDERGRLTKKVELKYRAPDWTQYNRNVTLYTYEYYS